MACVGMDIVLARSVPGYCKLYNVSQYKLALFLLCKDRAIVLGIVYCVTRYGYCISKKRARLGTHCSTQRER